MLYLLFCCLFVTWNSFIWPGLVVYAHDFEFRAIAFYFFLLLPSLWLMFESSFFGIIDLICLIQYLSMSFYHCLIRTQCPSNICNIIYVYVCMYLIRLTSLLHNRKVLHIYVKSWFNRRTEQTFTLIVLNTLNDEWFLLETHKVEN